VEVMLRVAALFGKRGKHAEQLRWLERAVALHPQSAPAREALAKAQGPEGKQEPEAPAPSALRRAPDGSPVPDNAGLLPDSHPPAQRKPEPAAVQAE
jgi:hypothetical protein